MSGTRAAELGRTADPRALVPGDPAAVEATADLLRAQAPMVEDVGTGLRRVDVPSWTGAASAAFHDAFDPQAARWFAVATIMTDAAARLASYASTLRTAQAMAGEAIALWARGQAETARARLAFEQEQQAIYLTAPGSPLPQADHCAVFVDTGEPLRAQARETLARARHQLDGAGHEAAGALAALAGLRAPSGTSAPPAPREPRDGWTTSSDVLGTSGTAEGPKVRGRPGDHEYGGAPWSSDWAGGGDRSDQAFELSLGELSGAAWLWKGQAAWKHSYGALDVSSTMSAQAFGVDGAATAKIDESGFAGLIEAEVVQAKASAEAQASYRMLAAEAEADGLVGGRAAGAAEVGAHGVHAAGEAFVGARASGGLSGDVGGLGGGLTAEGWYGAGAALDGEWTFRDGKLTVGEQVGLAMGVGGKIGGEITLDLPKMWRTTEDAVTALADLLH